MAGNKINKEDMMEGIFPVVLAKVLGLVLYSTSPIDVVEYSGMNSHQHYFTCSHRHKFVYG